jgi:hypothetical protein
MPTTLEPQLVQPRATRPIYLKRVPTPVWERVHVNAIKSGMRLTDYLVSVLANAEPLARGSTPSGQVGGTLSMTSPPANGNG